MPGSASYQWETDRAVHHGSGRLAGQCLVTVEDWPGSASWQWKTGRAEHHGSGRLAGQCIVAVEDWPGSASRQWKTCRAVHGDCDLSAANDCKDSRTYSKFVYIYMECSVAGTHKSRDFLPLTITRGKSTVTNYKA
ncbi:hypothetical protein PoB_003524100 [Plakobranchus ocellatus]|uniref:Uncharacterized protein n=1 Tax=Plakobranchus ocellatus TaxID=259542 RepID=A0AAV4AKA7_9GAST|nr:hypothetical protein PoB_003524100 [Plakobranchus ocellatus]